MPTSHTSHFNKRTGASAGEAPLILLEITHPELLEPVRVVNDSDDLYQGLKLLDLPGVDGSDIRTPDSVNVSLTGDLEVQIIWESMEFKAGNNLIFDKAPAQTSYFCFFGCSQAGTYVDAVTFAVNGTYVNAVIPSSAFQSSEYNGIKIVFDADDGASGHTVKAYLTKSLGASWSQLGTTYTGSGTKTIPDTSGELIIGYRSGGIQPPKMRIRSFKLYDAATPGGTLKAGFDTVSVSYGATSFVSGTGETWTLQTSGDPPAKITADKQFTACAFQISLPDDQAGNMPRAPITIDNLGGELMAWLDSSYGGRGAQIRMMQVMRDTPDVIELEYTLDLLNVRQNLSVIVGELGYENILDRPALLAIYTPETAPGLF